MSNPEVEPSSKNVTKVAKETCFMVPLSLQTKRSAVARVIEEADVFPSNIFNSDVVIVFPSKTLISDAVAVTPSKIFSSDVVAVIPSKTFNSEVVTVAPSRIATSVQVRSASAEAVPLDMVASSVSSESSGCLLFN